jgi:signal transduction histidine kinase/CHASE1-domain containing sensor protein
MMQLTKTWPAWAILCIGLLGSVFAGLQIKSDIEQDAIDRFAFSCDQVTLKIQERLAAYALILRGGAGLFGAAASVERQEWHDYVKALQASKLVPGVQGIGFTKVIAADRLSTHIAEIRREGFPDYTVRPPGERAIYTSIIYLEPFSDRNLRAFGFDMFSEPVRRAAMEQARDTGEATLSGKVELVQETARDVQAGTLMYVPVYRNRTTPDTVEQKRAALIGWVYSPYRMNDLLGGILSNGSGQQGKNVDLQIYDDARKPPDALLFRSIPATAPALHSLFYQTRMIDFNGRQWLLTFDQAEERWGISYTPAWLVLTGSIVITGLLFFLMLSLINTRAEADRIATKLTADIQEHSEQFKAIFALSPDGFITFDASHCIKYVSPAFAAMTGLNEEVITGLNEADFSEQLASRCAPEASFPGVAKLRALKEAIRAGTPQGSATTNQNADVNNRGSADAYHRQHRTIELTGPDKRVLQVNLRISTAERVSNILYFRDITRETEVDRMKSEFLSHAAHELRTPMASIYGFTELLLTQKFDETERHDLLSTVFGQSELMISIINELLDLARIEARRGKDFRIVRIDIHELLQEVVTGFKVPNGRSSLALPPANAPLWVGVDRSKLIQAISNVISNAYKYSPHDGTVNIELLRTTMATGSGANSDGTRVGIRITDHGIGMTPEQLARVCERFYRADTSGKIPGTGLGMSIVKEIVELHGGELEVTSKAGTGSTVTIWLPSAETITDSIPLAAAHQGKPS